MSKSTASSRPRKPSLPKLIEKYYADLNELAQQNVMYEMGVRPAFHALLQEAGREHRWTLIAEHEKKVNYPVLAPYVPLIRRNRLRGRRKDVTAKAHVRRDGSISVRGHKGRIFKSPSMAARHVLGHNANGWDFWQYERSPGEWVSLAHLRD